MTVRPLKLNFLLAGLLVAVPLVAQTPAELPLSDPPASEPEGSGPALSGPAGSGRISQTPPLPAPSLCTPVGSEGRKASWKVMGANILCDQKPIWTFPVRATQRKHLKPVLGVALGTAALVVAEPHMAPYFRDTATFRDFNRVASGQNTSIAMTAFPVSFYALGLIRKDPYARSTALLAGEAVADSEILTTIMKSIDRRHRPADVPTNGNFSDTWFESRDGWALSGKGSFPSGHTIAAFSVATVFAERYRRHRWVPWLAYGLAGMIGFSRVTLQSHFPSDVFAGAVLGYSISRYVVLGGRSQRAGGEEASGIGR